MINHLDRFRQVIDYGNMQWGKLAPMDVDGMMEIDGYKLLLLEYKYGDAPMPEGQRIALERMADNWVNAEFGNDALVLVAVHYAPVEKIVDGSEAVVRQFYHNGKWTDNYDLEKTVKRVVEDYMLEDIKRKNG